MEEPTAILTFFRQFPEVLNTAMIEESPYWEDIKKKDFFPVILSYADEKRAKCNSIFKADETSEQQEKDVDEAEDCSVVELTNTLNERDDNHGKDQSDQAKCQDSEPDCVEVASDAIEDGFASKNCSFKTSMDEQYEVDMQDEFEPSFEEDGVQKISPDLSTFPLKSPISNIHLQSPDISTQPPQGSTMTRATFSPSGSPTDKQIQLPALFSGLRVLRKGVVGPDHDTISQLKPISQGSKSPGTFLDQISLLLNREKQEVAEEVSKQNESSDSLKKEGATVEARSSADAVFDAFKAFFTPKPLKRDPAEKVDLEAVRKKIRSERELLRTIFEKTDEEASDGKSESPTDAEDRTPGRLQAV